MQVASICRSVAASMASSFLTTRRGTMGSTVVDVRSGAPRHRLYARAALVRQRPRHRPHSPAGAAAASRPAIAQAATMRWQPATCGARPWAPRESHPPLEAAAAAGKRSHAIPSSRARMRRLSNRQQSHARPSCSRDPRAAPSAFRRPPARGGWAQGHAPSSHLSCRSTQALASPPTRRCSTHGSCACYTQKLLSLTLP